MPKLLSLTAEELLRELVEEHRDTTFEFKSPMGWVRSGMWVGGEKPIQDSKTKIRFKMLKLWCQQVSALPPCTARLLIIILPSFSLFATSFS